MKKLVSLFLILSLFYPLGLSVCAAPMKVRASMETNFDLDESIKTVKFHPNKTIKIGNTIQIPPEALVTADVLKFQQEKRWHKSGFILLKLKSYELDNKTIEITQEDAYVAARKYEAIDKKEATILAIELAGFGALSFFVPGIDIGYFFLKGVIQGKKHPNRFIAGVHNAYDNSIFWFIEKGKPIKLNQGDKVNLKYMTKADVLNTKASIEYANFKKAFKEEKRLVKNEIKQLNKLAKNEDKLLAKEQAAAAAAASTNSELQVSAKLASINTQTKEYKTGKNVCVEKISSLSKIKFCSDDFDYSEL